MFGAGIVMAVTLISILAVSGNGVSDTVPSTAASRGAEKKAVKTRAAPLPSAILIPLCLFSNKYVPAYP